MQGQGRLILDGNLDSFSHRIFIYHDGRFLFTSYTYIARHKVIGFMHLIDFTSTIISVVSSFKAVIQDTYISLCLSVGH